MSEQQRLQRARDFLLQAVETLGESRRDSPSQSAERAAVRRPASVTPRSAIITRSTDSLCRSTSVTSAVAERNKLFHYRGHPKSKKKRLCLWTHDFVCLSKTTDSKAPTSFEAGELLRAGLGKKQLSLMEDGDSTDVHAEIMAAFPKLKEGGGYELLRASDFGGQRRELVLIPSPSEGYTVSYLKEVLRQAKVYVRPVQQNLNLIELSSSCDFKVRVPLY